MNYHFELCDTLWDGGDIGNGKPGVVVFAWLDNPPTTLILPLKGFNNGFLRISPADGLMS